MMKRASLIVVLLLLVAVPVSAQQVRVKGNRTPLRSEATVSSTALTYFQAGTRLTALAFVDGFYKVRDPQTGREGYILATLVELLPGSAGVPEARRPAAAAPPIGGQLKPGLPGQLAPARAPARRAGDWTDRGYVALGAVYQNGLPGFSDALSYTENVEQATITTTYPSKKAVAGDIGGAVRVWRNLAIGVSVTMASYTNTGSITGTIPHPFFFGAGRAISGSASLKRSEIAVYPFVSWSIPAGRRFLVVVGGGPSIFNLKQSLVEGVSYTQSYPYDSVTFTSATVVRRSASAVGYAGSVDVGYYFTRIVGIGVVARYARATVSLPSHGSSVKVNTGGLEAGVGLRFRIPQGKPKRTPVRQPIPSRPAKR